MIVEIPTWFVPLADIDYRAELMQTMNRPLHAGRLALPAPYPAWFTMLELIESPYFRDPLSCSAMDAAKALWMLSERREARAGLESDRPATEFLLKYGNDLTDNLAEIVQWTHVVPFGGFEMIPPGKGKEPLRGPWLFDAEYLSGIGLTLARATGTTFEEAIWSQPVCLAGFLRMHEARANGIEHVERPPDIDELHRIQKESLDRAERGEKQPWEQDETDD